MMSRTRLIVSVSTLLALAGHACAQLEYDFVPLGLPPGQTNTTVVDLDEQGRVLVYVVTTTPAPWGTRSYIWENGAFTQVGPYLNYARTEAQEFGPAGSVVGYSYLVSAQWPTTVVGWTWKDGVFTKLPSLGGAQTNAVAINAGGQCTGWSYPASPFNSFGSTFIATATSSKLVGDVRWLTGNGVDINDAGLLCSNGVSLLDFSWQTSMVTSPEGGLHDLGTLGGLGAYMSFTNAMNNSGQIVGSSYTGNEPANQFLGQAFVWQEGVMKPLTPLPGDITSTAFGINEAGDIVGQSGPSGQRHAVIWKDGGVTDLATKTTLPSGWTLFSGKEINEQGVIAGQSVVAGVDRSWVLIPKP